MISKKMRNISMVCLSLVLALTLAFGLSSFSVKKASAIEVGGITSIFDGSVDTTFEGGSDDGSSWSQLGGSVASPKKTSNSANVVDGVTYSKVLNFGSSTSSSSRYITFTIKTGYEATCTVVFGHNNTGRGVCVGKSATSSYDASTYGGAKNSSSAYYTSFTTKVLTADTYYVNFNNGIDIAAIKLTYTKVPVIYSYAINSVANPTGEYSLMQGQDLSYADLPTEVTGTVTSDDPDAPATIAVPVTNWTADTSAVGTVVATGTLGSVEGYTLGVETVTANITVKEIEKIEITSFEAIDSISKVYGTAQGDLGLPATVIGSNGDDFKVTWEIEPEYTGAVGNYTATGTVEYDETYYTVTAANPTVAIEITAIPVVSQTLEGTYYTFDNANVLGLPTTIAVSGVDFEISWNTYVADSAAITGSLVAKAGYDVSNATVTANVEKIISSKSAYFNSADAVEDAVGYSYEGAFEAGNGDHFVGLKISKKSLAFAIAEESEVAFVVSGKNGVSIKFNGETLSNSENDLYIDYKGTLPAGRYVIDATSSGQNAFVCYVSIANSETTEYIVGENNTLPTTAQAKDGYTFIGWTDGNNALKTGSVDANSTNASRKIYTAVYAKAEYLGISFRKSAESPAVRFGYVVTIVDANENALNGLTLNASAVFNIDNLTNSKSTDVPFESLKIAYNENKGGYLANLAITGIDSAKAQNALNVDMTITINGVSITAESDAIESDTIVSKAQKLYDAGQLTDAQAEIYGVVLNG